VPIEDDEQSYWGITRHYLVLFSFSFSIQRWDNNILLVIIQPDVV